MDSPDQNISIACQLICKDLQLMTTPKMSSIDSLKQLKDVFIPIINHLLDHDFPKLIQGLYRIDVNEDKVKTALTHEDSAQIAPIIADLIVQRGIQKAITRSAYK